MGANGSGWSLTQPLHRTFPPSRRQNTLVATRAGGPRGLVTLEGRSPKEDRVRRLVHLCHPGDDLLEASTSPIRSRCSSAPRSSRRWRPVAPRQVQLHWEQRPWRRGGLLWQRHGQFHPSRNDAAFRADERDPAELGLQRPAPGPEASEPADHRAPPPLRQGMQGLEICQRRHWPLPKTGSRRGSMSDEERFTLDRELVGALPVVNWCSS